MSLTSLIGTPYSSVGGLFRDSFEPSSFLSIVRNKIRKYKCIGPYESNRRHAYLIGTAIDYRLRFYFGIPPFYSLVAFKGAVSPNIFSSFGLWGKEGDFKEGALMYFTALNSFLRTHDVPKRRLNVKYESELNRHCLTLAKLDLLFRCPDAIQAVWARGGSPEELEIYYRFYGIFGNSLMRGVSRLLQYWGKDIVNEMNELSYLFYVSQKSLITRCKSKMRKAFGKYRMDVDSNPAFSLSYMVGGADADIIINKTLIDFKTIYDNIGSKDLYQLLGYTLLDNRNEYKIKRVGIYFVRRGLLLKWKLKDFYKMLNPKYKFLGKFKERFYRSIRSRF